MAIRTAINAVGQPVVQDQNGAWRVYNTATPPATPADAKGPFAAGPVTQTPAPSATPTPTSAPSQPMSTGAGIGLAGVLLAAVILFAVVYDGKKITVVTQTPPPAVTAPDKAPPAVAEKPAPAKNLPAGGVHSYARPIADPSCFYAQGRMQMKPAPNAIRVRNPHTGKCSWYVGD